MCKAGKDDRTGVCIPPNRLGWALTFMGVSGRMLRDAVRVSLRWERPDFLRMEKSGVGTTMRTCRFSGVVGEKGRGRGVGNTGRGEAKVGVPWKGEN